MRPVHPRNLRLATRGTTREINRSVVLNLIRINQPISRADLARLMGTRRGAVSVLVNQLIADGAVFEGATGEAKRGRKPTFLYMESRKRCVVAVDIRPTRTFVMVTDLLGQQLEERDQLPDRTRSETPRGRSRETDQRRAGRTPRPRQVRGRRRRRAWHGGYRDRSSPVGAEPGWRDFSLRDSLAAVVAVPVEIENSGKACALAQLWSTRDGGASGHFVYLNVSDGLGVGVVLGGQLVRGHHNIAGEFGHIPLNLDGPRCGCGATAAGKCSSRIWRRCRAISAVTCGSDRFGGCGRVHHR